jgi:hypothetical protein
VAGDSRPRRYTRAPARGCCLNNFAVIALSCSPNKLSAHTNKHGVSGVFDSCLRAAVRSPLPVTAEIHRARCAGRVGRHDDRRRLTLLDPAGAARSAPRSSPHMRVAARQRVTGHDRRASARSSRASPVRMVPISPSCCSPKATKVHGIKRRSSSFNTDRVDHSMKDPHTPTGDSRCTTAISPTPPI